MYTMHRVSSSASTLPSPTPSAVDTPTATPTARVQANNVTAPGDIGEQTPLATLAGAVADYAVPGGRGGAGGASEREGGRVKEGGGERGEG